MSKILEVLQHYGTGDADPTNGILALSYDTVAEEWSWVGDSYVESASGGWPYLDEPATCRIQSVYSMYYADWVVDDSWLEKLRLYVWDSLGRHVYDLWEWEDGVTQFYGSISNHNTADCSGDTIACLCYMTMISGEAVKKWAIKVSIDRGVNWKTVYYFPALTTVTLAQVRIDESGNIWVAYGDRGPGEIYLYKSEDAGDTFTLVSTTTTANISTEIQFSIDSTGQYQYIASREQGGDPVWHSMVYVSDDYGATFTPIVAQEGASITQKPRSTSNGVNYNCLSVAGEPAASSLRHSGDSAATYTDVPIEDDESTGAFFDIQSSGDELVAIDCAADFGSATAADYNNVLYSDDNGATVAVIDSPAPTPDAVDKSLTIDTHEYSNSWSQGCVGILAGGTTPPTPTGSRCIEYFAPHELFHKVENGFFVHCGLVWNGGTMFDITNIQKGSLIVTAPDHDFEADDKVRIYDVLGMVEANSDPDGEEYYTVSSVDGDNFTIAAVNSALFTAYTSGGKVGKVGNSVSGLPASVFTDGRLVRAVGDGRYEYNGTDVASGALTLPFYANNIVVGLPYAMILEPNNPAAGSSLGSVRGKPQRINAVTLAFHETIGCEIGMTQDALQEIPIMAPGELSRVVHFETGILFSDDMTFEFDGDWERKATISIVSDNGMPFLLKAVIPELNVNEPPS